MSDFATNISRCRLFCIGFILVVANRIRQAPKFNSKQDAKIVIISGLVMLSFLTVPFLTAICSNTDSQSMTAIAVRERKRKKGVHTGRLPFKQLDRAGTEACALKTRFTRAIYNLTHLKNDIGP